MEDILIECSPGISGDMLLGALYDLGVPKKVIENPLIDLGFKNQYNLDFKESKSCSIRGIRTKVEHIDCAPIKRNWKSIKELILNGNLEEKLSQIIFFNLSSIWPFKIRYSILLQVLLIGIQSIFSTFALMPRIE